MKRAGGEEVLYDSAAFVPGVSARSRSGIPPSPAEVGTPALLLTERDLALCAAINSAEWLRASPSNGILYDLCFLLVCLNWAYLAIAFLLLGREDNATN